MIVLDAVGPERPTFFELVDTVRQAVGSRARLVRVPGPLVPLLASALGTALRDVLLTRGEFRAMADRLADTDGPATGEVALSTWVWDHREMLGQHYAKDLR